MIDIVLDESPIGHVGEYDAVIVGTNCYQAMNNGFQREVALKYPYVREENFRTKYGDPEKLGGIVECRSDGNPLFILAFVTFGFNFKGNDKDYFQYDALVKCLRLLNILYNGKHLATTMIGCTEFDGNADRDRVIDIINREVRDFDLTIYDYRQESNKAMNQREYIRNLKKRYARNKEKRQSELAGKAGKKTMVK